MNTEQRLQAIRQARLETDPSALEEYAVDSAYLEVQALIKSETGVQLDVQSTRHCVVYSIVNEYGGIALDFDQQYFVVHLVVEAIKESFRNCATEIEAVLVEAGLRQEE
jgi:hypothetical protein